MSISNENSLFTKSSANTANHQPGRNTVIKEDLGELEEYSVVPNIPVFSKLKSHATSNKIQK